MSLSKSSPETMFSKDQLAPTRASGLIAASCAPASRGVGAMMLCRLSFLKIKAAAGPILARCRFLSFKTAAIILSLSPAAGLSQFLWADKRLLARFKAKRMAEIGVTMVFL